MLYWLFDLLRGPIHNSRLFGIFAVFDYVEFRAVASVVISFFFVIALGRRTILWLVKQKVGDQPEFYLQDLNTLMKGKKNTPTMGGILIVGSIFATTLLMGNFASFYVILAMTCLVWLFVIGLFDDYLKLTAAQRKPGSREGLYSHEKLIAQVALALILGLFLYKYGINKERFPDPDVQMISHALTLPFAKTWVLEAHTYVPSPHLIVLGQWTFVMIAILVITGSSNAVNLTDGMDGLASGVMVMVAAAFLVLCLIAGFTHDNFVLAKYLLVPYIPLSDELAVVAGAMTGACLGFLWFNCSPAQVFMGDSGSLPLGGLIGFIAVAIRQEFLLVIIGGIFVIEALSVILQVGYFKATKGKRIFRCAPIHHHFHLGGWTEQQVVIRAWLITAMLAALAIASLKLR